MEIGKVIGNVWSTRKSEELNGLKLLIVASIDCCNNMKNSQTFVATDSVGAGIGDIVLIVKGSPSRRVIDRLNAPVDATIVGIIDEFKVEEDFD
ncbi:EutN/CcmL family microcompartment protein [Dethiothermospora halolimnae]|uniref:EutN/CcmL family microcompartment protein n=1 Tax=Dethiothermospora halolimnae TaxID=3114390 RepID=UPI003CCBB0D7